ncbi:multiprotein bridging factor aMBF1 [Halorientalis salina]|uniref:multiprotein bridging factor aMBF1 n=1 Tax=Halorientalis salina TaxID=2932266 RepID=UPI0010ACE4AC|nr:multiprotein bridging factor aMBF1 [Halorientalis salina]
MVQCEMCGAETSSPNTVKVEGAELDVCDDCADFGTEVRTQETSSTSTKYSTGSSSSSGGSSSSGASSSSGTSSRSSGSAGSSGGGGRDMFDELDEVAQDFDERIRTAREAAGLSQSELASQLNEKASLIQKLEQGDTLPTDSVQTKIERELDIDLTEGGGSGEETDWSSDTADGTMTLGDKVQRKDS